VLWCSGALVLNVCGGPTSTIWVSGVDEFKNEYKDICKKIVEKVKSY